MLGIENRTTKRIRRVPPERRKKVSSACDTCKKRKLKCDGGQPCLTCMKRGVDCKITSIDGRTLKGKIPSKVDSYFGVDENGNSVMKKVEVHKVDLGELEENDNISTSDQDSSQSKSDTTSEHEKEKDAIEGQNGKSCLLLQDEHGGDTYIGERSFLSLLYECRNMFREATGPSKFTEDLQKCAIFDKPIKVGKAPPVNLPDYKECVSLVEEFHDQINLFFYVVDIEYFKKFVVDAYYNDPNTVEEEQIALLYLVMSIGSLQVSYTKKSRDISVATEYFRSGLYKMQEIGDDTEIWLVQAHFLSYFFYQAILKKSSAWLSLNVAIKRAESMGIQRAFIRQQYLSYKKIPLMIPNLLRSLYICDRISSAFLGRPISIRDNEWEFVNEPDAHTSFLLKCQMELAKLGKIIEKTMVSFSKSETIDFETTKEVAVELKNWSINLSSDLQIDQINHICSPSYDGPVQDGYAILLVHVVQLNSVMFLGSPFLMFEMATKVRPEFQNKPRNRKLAVELFQATVRASVLMIHLTYYYLSNNQVRIGIHIVASSTFSAALIVGMRLLHGGFEDDGHSSEELKKCLTMAIEVVNSFKHHSEAMERFRNILVNFKDTLDSVEVSNMKRMYYIDEQIERSLSQFDAEFFNSLKVADSHDPNLEALIQFQRLFLPQDSAPTDEYMSEDTIQSKLPYHCGTSDLLTGDKF